MIDLSICIVNFNTKLLLQKCLRSIYKNTPDLKFEIILVDNGSADGSIKMVRSAFANIKIIANKSNLFYSKAYNLAFKKSIGRYILILNTDTIIPRNSLKEAFIFMQKNPKVAAVSCREIDENNKVDKTCSRFPTPFVEFLESNIMTKPFRKTNIIKKYRYSKWHRNSTKEVDVIPGSFIFTRKSIIEKIGYFDENLILYYGENDLCLRIKKIGGKIFHLGKITITHLQSQTVKLLPASQIYTIALHDMLYYYRKHFGFAWWLFLWITYRANWIYWKVKTEK